MSIPAAAESFKSPDEVRCRRCNATPRPAYKLLNPRTGVTLRMYKCECGEQMWIDLPCRTVSIGSRQ
jgi:hypothetical protein